jgi:serine/threonine protein kinase
MASAHKTQDSGNAYRMGDAIAGTNYQFVRLLGEGGQGVVYEVRERTLRVHYAMKLLSARIAGSDRGAADLQKEAQMLAQHVSPFLVRVFGAGVTAEAEPRPFFVMDLLEGASLHEILRSTESRRLPIRTALNLTIQVLEGLDAAHTHRTYSLIHRDIKPSNIWIHMVSPVESNAVILDLGIAKLLGEAKPGAEESGRMFVGTFDYAAPEQYTSGAVVQSDLYAVACTLFEMIVGRRVFIGKDGREVVAQHLKEQAPRMSKFVPVPVELDTYVATALEKDFRKRPRSAFEFLNGLKAIRAVLEERERERQDNNKTDDMDLKDMYNQVQERKARIDALMDTIATRGDAPRDGPGHGKGKSLVAFPPTLASEIAGELAKDIRASLPAPRANEEPLESMSQADPQGERARALREAPTRTARGANEALGFGQGAHVLLGARVLSAVDSKVSPYAHTSKESPTAPLVDEGAHGEQARGGRNESGGPKDGGRALAGTLPIGANRPAEAHLTPRPAPAAASVVHHTELLPGQSWFTRARHFAKRRPLLMPIVVVFVVGLAATCILLLASRPKKAEPSAFLAAASGASAAPSVMQIVTTNMNATASATTASATASATTASATASATTASATASATTASATARPSSVQDAPVTADWNGGSASGSRAPMASTSPRKPLPQVRPSAATRPVPRPSPSSAPSTQATSWAKYKGLLDE